MTTLIRVANNNKDDIMEQQDWGVDDNWSTLSDDSPDTEHSLFALNQDPVLEVAKSMELHLEEQQQQQQQQEASTSSCNCCSSSTEEDLIHDVIDGIHSPILNPNEPALYDTQKSFEEYSQTIHFEDELGTEIGLLVRCNESPDDLLVMEGRALPALTKEDQYSPLHLLRKVEEIEDEVDEVDEPSLDTNHAIVGGYKPTDYFYNAVSTMFHQHSSVSASTSTTDEKDVVMNSEGIASWMTQSLGGPKVGMFDKRVGAVLSRYATHGSGVLTVRQFIHLYMDAAVVDINVVEKRRIKKLMQKVKLELPTMESVWRDLQNHGFESPSLTRKCMQLLLLLLF